MKPARSAAKVPPQPADRAPSHRRPAMTSRQRLGFTLALLVFLTTWARPIWPFEQALHSVLSVLGFVALAYYPRRHRISDSSFALLCLFLSVHCLAARWLYSNVPYDAWMESLLGLSLTDAMGWRRNHFDRLVHLLFGFCLVPAAMEFFQARYRRGRRENYLLALTMVLVAGLFYEWIEWGVALVMDPEYAEAYNGQQGDMWDPHKDMLMNLAGGLLWLPRVFLSRPRPTRDGAPSGAAR